MELFDYQQEMVERMQKAFRKHQSVMAQMPTGTGKTYLLAAVVKSEEQRVKNPCVWIVAHRRELVAQIIDTLKRFSLSPDSTNIKVMSIQWLTLHYREMRDRPSLIVIDEAHHAVAKTYAEVMRAFPKAKKLGLTATPYRLNGEGFMDLFDVLLTSWSMERFIAKGRLSLYDYYSIKPDGQDQRLIDSLKKRGADGDYQQKELNEVMDVRPSLERLCMTVKQYVPRKKGIVYAFSIEHAEHIAEFYRENGINAVAISSKTPSSLRKELLERFKKSSFTANTSSLNSFSKTHPSSLTIKAGSTAFPKPLSPQGTGDVAGSAIAPPEFWSASEALAHKGLAGVSTQQSCDCLSAGASKNSPDCLCGVNRLAGETAGKTAVGEAADVLSRVKVMSIQWLTLHYREMREVPSLIVIDEAHHAVAKTYAEVMRAFPKAKKLGLTATPYRLKGEGFMDLFDTLLTSWSMERFIAKGRLSLYDYYSIKPDGLDQRLIDSLKKRGADGDYQQKELNEVMDVRPSLERLCMTVKRYVPRKKGIVYAFSIEHAEHIAEFYRENDINAVAISSKTPSNERKSLVEQFKKGKIRVLVSVDLFSEGFDCPDVQFIQLARPTLSLAKYLQMVGRGLRVARRKSYCVILDNVGLYRRFGMPSADRDWQRMFEGRSQFSNSLQELCMRINNNFCHWGSVVNEDEEMMKILGHDRQRKMIEDSENDEIVEDKDGWIDRRSGLRFAKRPQTVRLLGVEFCTEDGMRFYPRIRSKFIDDKAYINLKSLELQVGRGINWKRKFIPLDEPNKVYQLQDKLGSVRLYVDEENNCYAQGNPDMELTLVHTQDEMNAYCQKYSRKEKKAAEKHQKIYKHGLFYPIHNSIVWERDGVQKGPDEIWYVPKDVFGESYWVDGISGLKHYAKPVAEQRGFVRLLKVDDWYYVRNIPDLRDTALRNWQIVADDNICVINNTYLFLKQEPRMWFKILKKTDDFSYFVVKEYKNFSGYAIDSDIYITQDSRHGLRLESNGVPYVPYFQTVSRAELRKYNL